MRNCCVPKLFARFLPVLWLFFAIAAYGGETVSVDLFNPEGAARGVRQAMSRFTEAIVPFGDPRISDPFDAFCTGDVRGRGRWADDRNWVYDFEEDLPAGIRCSFTLKPELRSVSGKPVKGRREFVFDTGGPMIMKSDPYEGSGRINENQAFVLMLDAAADEQSILSNVYFSVAGIVEAVSPKIVRGKDREALIEASHAKWWRKNDPKLDSKIVILMPTRSFPLDSNVTLWWGAGVRTVTGIQTTEAKERAFRTRNAFSVSFQCNRLEKGDNCVPVLPMRVGFSDPVRKELAEKIVLRGPGGKTWKPSFSGGEEHAFSLINYLVFPGPFPEEAGFKVELPPDLVDDDGRVPVNRNKFPLSVATGPFPPLVKFAAPFGIVESREGAALPLTVRNVEAQVKGQRLDVHMSGRAQAFRAGDEGRIVEWLRKVGQSQWKKESRRVQLLPGGEKTTEFSIPKPGGEKAFEVMGIPLSEPGFYVVEVKSERLGKALLGGDPMYVRAAALVTNLSAHFKNGRESSLVWVTSLDRGEPVEMADVTVRDSAGKVLWEGKTNSEGVARIEESLPRQPYRSECFPNCGYFVTASKGKDMTFVLSEWTDGIEPYRFRLPAAYIYDPVIAHTVFDRLLFKAGETVNMKHFLRLHRLKGLFSVEGGLPSRVFVRHEGSDQKFEAPISWSSDGSAVSEWAIPKDAKLGVYSVSLKGGQADYHAGEFRVEEYRVPLMKGSINTVGGTKAGESEIELDLMLSYLSGGGAGGAEVQLRTHIFPKHVHFPEYGDFMFSSGRIAEGISKRESDDSYWMEYEDREREDGGRSAYGAAPGKSAIQTRTLVLDDFGVLRTKVGRFSPSASARDLMAELEYMDPNGEIQTVSTRVPLWPSRVLLGIKPDSWAASKDALKFQVLALDLSRTPVKDVKVSVEMLQRKSYSHRKRLLGGMYSYEHISEVVKIGAICDGTTDALGLLTCETKSPVSGNVIIQASASDGDGNASFANRDVWVAGKDDWWFDASNDDRIDLLPEKKRYEPGDNAVFQVRMPFREATALITVEREGIADVYVRKLSGKSPVVEIPIKPHYAPNVYVSVLCIRGRVDGIAPTSMVDLAKPAFKLGIAGIDVGWRAHEMKVEVKPERDVFRVREKAKVKIRAQRADGGALPEGTEAVVTAVDEGILELAPNGSWKLLDAMMNRRSCEVTTSTSQMQVIGKRHFGLKALPQGGGGGQQQAREHFDSLLFWNARVPLNADGEAEVEIPLNDSITSFRIVAVASGGTELFGTGEASIRSTQDLVVMSGLPPVVREGDKFRAGFTVRNASEKAMKVQVDARMASRVKDDSLPAVFLELEPGQAHEAAWDMTVPADAGTLSWDVSAFTGDKDSSDRIRVTQSVKPAVPVRIFQATLAQVAEPLDMKVRLPSGALAGRGGVEVAMRSKLSDGMSGVTHYMSRYPYTCLEQLLSRAVVLRDEALWNEIVSKIPSYLDRDGLAKYFPGMGKGSDALTSYILSIANEAGWKIPDASLERMINGLEGFVAERVVRHGAIPSADLPIRKMAALEALSRYGKADVSSIDTIKPDPHLWPTSGVIDWLNVLLRVKGIPNRDKRIAEAESVLRSRMNFQGTAMRFSTEGRDHLCWLMVSVDSNSVRALTALMGRPGWKEDIPRMVRGAVGRQQKGSWSTTVANAWGILAMEKFSKIYESEAVSGKSMISLDDIRASVDWEKNTKGNSVMLPWPQKEGTLNVSHAGKGRPWATVSSLVALPLNKPFSSGYEIKKTMAPVQQKKKGIWSRGDVVRVTLSLDAQADESWVVVNDPIPAGATILGSGLGRDSKLLTQGEQGSGWAWPAFTERSHEAFRAYYEFTPKGKWVVEYTVRLNNEGTFLLPPTRVEALYSPEMFGEYPNPRFVVSQ
ncbi:MAG: MG2 domain-containing protein [Syntrophorhabdaceae bacterium]|nr:MG2 domain-containing protein [Syntrophorhabdaceae bacterium]